MEKENFLSKFTKLSKRQLVIISVLIVVFTGVAFAVMEKISDNPAFCASCHNMQSYYDSYHDSNLLAHKHAEAGVSCHDCHEPLVTQQVDEGIKYVTGNFETPLEKRQFSNDNCLKCHNMKVVRTKTDFEESNPHESHQGKQNCYECHSMHRQSSVMCTERCHSFNWAKNLPDNWKKSE